MTLVKTRAAFETVIQDKVQEADPTVTVVFDNTPFTQPGLRKKYVMVSLDFTQSTTQAQGAAQDYYSGTITCGVMTPKNKGTAAAAEIAKSVIDGLTSVNSSTYTDTFFVTPRVSQIAGPTSVSTERESHFLSVVSCSFTANA
tara:strand:+ start:773 stop:1201 length:429 start_codon:yes stop_codon:yes gene_type:complete